MSLEDDLGHVDNLLRNKQKRVEEVEDFRRLFHHQRHRNIEHRQTRDGVDDLLHSVSLCPFLRHDASEAVRPRPPELRHAVVVSEVEVPRAGLLEGGFFRNVAVQCTSYPLPTPGLLLSPWGGVVVRLGHEHRDG